MLHDSKVTRQGQTTIPKDIREKYGIEEGDEVTYIDMGDHIILLPKPKNPIEALRNLCVDEAKTVYEIRTLASEEAVEDSERRRGA